MGVGMEEGMIFLYVFNQLTFYVIFLETCGLLCCAGFVLLPDS